MKRRNWYKWIVVAVAVALVTLAAVLSRPAGDLASTDPAFSAEASETEAAVDAPLWRKVERGDGKTVDELFSHSTAYHDEHIDYGMLVDKYVYFDSPSAFLPWDEWLYLIHQVVMSSPGALKKIQVQNTYILVQNGTLYLKIDADYHVDNKFLRLFVNGRDTVSVTVNVSLVYDRSAGSFAVGGVSCSSPAMSDASLKTAFRLLTKHSDYQSLAATYLDVLVHVGAVGDPTGNDPVTEDGVSLILNTH